MPTFLVEIRNPRLTSYPVTRIGFIAANSKADVAQQLDLEYIRGEYYLRIRPSTDEAIRVGDWNVDIMELAPATKDLIHQRARL